MKELTIEKNDAGQRLDRFLGKALPLLPESLMQKYIRIKRIKLNGKGAKRNTILAVGDVLSLYINDEFFEKPNEKNAYLKISSPKLSIVYEDDNILLVDKKPGMLCHGADGDDYMTLVACIQARAYQNGEWVPRDEASFSPALCNRIDRNTGGIVIAAKNAETLRIINEKIRDREIEKAYLCVVSGTPAPKSGVLRGYIAKDNDKSEVRVYKTPKPGAKLSVTRYRTLASSNGLSLLECCLETGRTHQIRAQMANAGLPLLGDGKYGDPKQNKAFGETRQLLYSFRVVFSFKTDAGILDYLCNKSFCVNEVSFAEKYFPGIKF